MASTETLKLLITKRGQIKAKLTRFNNYIDSIGLTQDTSQLKIRYKNFEECLPAFEEIQNQIEVIEDKLDGQDTERESFENLYYELASKTESLLSLNIPHSTVTETPSTPSTTPGPTVKLPSINLPKFTGNYEDWLPFHDLFNSLVHNNTTLTDVEKFHYLQTSLEDKVKPILSSLESSSANYSTAWLILKERYDNKRIIVNKHIAAIVNMDPVTKENANALRNLLDNINKHIRCLNSLGQETESWDSILIYLLTKKLDSFTLRHWENQNTSKELPTLDSFLCFLKNRCQILEALDDTKANSTNVHSAPNACFKQPGKSGSLHLRKGHSQGPIFSHVMTNMHCYFCNNSNHKLFKCPRFLAKSSVERLITAKNLNLCTNCLSQGHTNTVCVSGSCRICSKKHNTLLHTNASSAQSNQKPFNPNPNSAASSSNATNTVLIASQPSVTTQQVLLSTAIVYVKDRYGTNHPCRALLDSGSQTHFMTNKMVQLLHLKKSNHVLHIKGINQIPSKSDGSVVCTIQSRCTNYAKNLEFQVVPTITQEMPNVSFDIAEWKLPPWVELSDPDLGSRGSIDMLIGAELFLELLCVGQFIPAPGAPILQKTLLGWIAGGRITTKKQDSDPWCLLTMTDNLQCQVKKFWELEEVNDVKGTSTEDKLCEEHYNRTTKRECSGRYTVSLPLKENIHDLGESYSQAKARFESTERKLDRNPELKARYNTFMAEYLSLNHMEPIYITKNQLHPNHPVTSSTAEGDPPVTQKTYYLPHLPVIKESSSTTKLRVVFDASAKTTSGLSLNDTMRVGPTIQADLFTTMCNFRTYKYAMTADIAKMYRQILINQDHADLQRILWRFNPNEELQLYRLNTVTYGMAAAPYLAIRTLHRLAEDERHQFPNASSVLKNDFYVDDLMTGAETLDDALKLQNEVTSLLKTGGFELRKWSASHPDLLQSVPEDKREHQSGSMTKSDHSVKILGMLWNASSDYFHFSIQSGFVHSVTKRAILSEIAGLFDPLGLLGPVVLTAKIFLQQLWALKLSWDESLPQNVHASWKRYREELNALEEEKIPRKVTPSYSEQITLHGFCDASEAAYGACLFIRQENSDGQVHVTLLCSKSRVAPLKKQTIPRLELCGALLLSRLVSKISKIKLKFTSCTLWCDSSIVLAWIKAEANTWKTFVSNRVQEINTLTQTCTWRHVSSKDNPADLVSRGIMPAQIINNKLWWHGPTWLHQPRNVWPVHEELISDIPERRKSTAAPKHLSIFLNQIDNKTSDSFIDPKHFSALQKLQRVTAYCLRFIHNCRVPSTKQCGALSTQEVSNALQYIIKKHQEEYFSHEIKTIKSGKHELKGRLKSLQPFLDNEGLLRVGGRLENAEIENSQKHPIILPEKSYLTDLIIINEHKRSLHSGPQLLLATIRQQYWPIGGRNSTRKIVRQCVDCFKAKPKGTQPLMGNIPTSRLTPSRPFSTSGVDYCGPIYIKSSNSRKCKLIKSYIAVFVCFSTKALHIELVSDLTTEAFLAAFKRFISRRGICKDIYSDNGSNFVGAYKEIQELRRLLQSQEHQHKVIDATSNQKTNWHFVPPYSPHFGGLWEAGVKSVKHHLKRVVRNANLTFEQLYTVLTMVEACLNSRPITPLSDDPSDPSPLTPGHFLTGEALIALPEPDLTSLQGNRLSQWQRTQQIIQHFWQRWSKEYLSLLQQRQKWTSGDNNLQPGQVVLVKDDNLPPLKWMTAVIVDTHPGADGRCRVASIKTATGVYKRAVNKLCVMPIDQ